MKIPFINSKVEQFDSSLFKSDVRQKGSMTSIYQRETTVYEKSDKHGNRLVYFSKGLGADGRISGYDYSVNPIIGIYKEYYPNGSIKSKGIYCWFGFKIGTWYYFDEEGELIVKEDFDEGFLYGFKQILSYCEREGISLQKKMDGPRLRIIKYKPKQDESFWFIKYPKSGERKYIVHQLSGKDGSLIKLLEEAMPSFKEDDSKRQ